MASIKQQQLDTLRIQLNQIDRTIIELLNQRMRIADEVARVKILHHIPLIAAGREGEIFARLAPYVEHPVLKEYLKRIYQGIIECSKATQALQENASFPFRKAGFIGMGQIGSDIAQFLHNKQRDVHLSALKLSSEDHQKWIHQ